MDFLNHREGGIIFYQVFFLPLLQCTVAGLYKCVRGKGVLITINVPVVYMGRYEVVLRGDYP